MRVLLFLLGSVAFAQTATFIKTDTTTQGNWVGVYGSDGYSIAQYKANLPSYLSSISPVGYANFTWANTTTDPRGLITTGTARIAACWYSGTTFIISLNFTDGNTHEVALYLLDWDGNGGGRRETIEVASTATGTVLSTQNIISFGNGVWLVYSMSGAVTVAVTNANSVSNAVASGIFFSPIAPPVTSGLNLCAGAVSQEGYTVVLTTVGTNWCLMPTKLLVGPAGPQGAIGPQGPPGVMPPIGPGLIVQNGALVPDSAVLVYRTWDQIGGDRFLTATSATTPACPSCVPGLVYTAMGSPTFTASTLAGGQGLVLQVDQPTQIGATLNIDNLGPVAFSGTCTRMCIILSYGSPVNTFLVH